MTIQSLVYPVQPDSALRFARESGLKEGDRVLVQLNVGVTVSAVQIEREGEAVLAQEATLHFCSSGWKILRPLPTLQSGAEMPNAVNIVGSLPVAAMPRACFIDGLFEVVMLNDRLQITPPRTLRVAAIPDKLHEEAPWAYPDGREIVRLYGGVRSSQGWLNREAKVVQN